MKRKQRTEVSAEKPAKAKPPMPGLAEAGRDVRQQLLSAWHKAWKERKTSSESPQ